MTTDDDSMVGRLHRRRKLLFGCGIALLAVLIVCSIGWWVFTRYLGDVLSATVEEQVNAAINGHLEFASLDVDLAGRAVLTDVEVFSLNSEAPVVRCPRAVIEFDLLNFIGPNRGKRAVVVTLHDPWLRVVREPSGSFNLASLAKEQAEEEFLNIGVAVHLHNATVDFTDLCMLDQAYPEIPATDGIAGSLLDELGYSASGLHEVPIFSSELLLNGNVVVNTERSEMSLNTTIGIGKTTARISAKGTASLDGSRLDMCVQVNDLELADTESYVNSLFPSLTLSQSTENQHDSDEQPMLAVIIKQGELHIQQKPGSEIELSGSCVLQDLHFASNTLPVLRTPRMKINYSDDSQLLNSELELHVLGCTVSGKSSLSFADDAIRGKLQIECADPAALFAEFGGHAFPLKGAVSTSVMLAGSMQQPEVGITLRSKQLSYGELDLGKLQGKLTLHDSWLKLNGVCLTGGAVALTTEGGIDIDSLDGRIGISVEELPVADLITFAEQYGENGKHFNVQATGNIATSIEMLFKDGQPHNQGNNVQ